MTQPARPSAHDIYDRVRQDAHDELERPSSSLAFSGLFAGFTIGATPLAYALALNELGSAGAAPLIASLVYPVGFIAVILGRAQLFTENTLYPVVLSFNRPSALPETARLWAIVYATNLIGSIAFAALLVETSAVSGDTVSQMTALGGDFAAGSFGHVFWSAVVAGWLLALIAWLVEATESAIAQFAVIWFLAVLVALGAFSHCVASSIDVGTAMLAGNVGIGDAIGWLATATLGNVAGGVLIVSLLNYGQVRADPDEG